MPFPISNDTYKAGYFVASITDLQAIPFGPTDDDGILIVVGNGDNFQLWRWAKNSTATPDSTTIIRPTSISSGNPGRCHLQSIATTQLPTLSGATQSTDGSAGQAPKPVAGKQRKFLSGAATYDNVFDYLTISANSTLTEANQRQLIDVNASGGNVTITLPAASISAGWAVSIRKLDSSSNSVIIQRAGADTINGATSITLQVQYQNVFLISSGSTNWAVVAGFGNWPIPIALGGTGQTTQQAALNTIAGGTTNNRVLRANGTNILLAQVDLTTDVTGSLPIANGGNFVNTSNAQTGIAGNKTFTGVVNFSNTTDSTSLVTGCAIFSGGVAINGFLTAGDNASIKIKRITGTTGATEGAIVTVAHGLSGAKIIGTIPIVTHTTGGGIPPGYTYLAGYLYSVTHTSTDIAVLNDSTNSENILSKPFSVLVVYIP